MVNNSDVRVCMYEFDVETGLYPINWCLPSFFAYDSDIVIYRWTKDNGKTINKFEME
ncbi:MAG: hypothetical protein PF569_03895 [Candidatus Woesearchaeota archaeon]|nr:hypothetical protein [Candidatus Woesearchaeota archaeon]